MINANEVRIGNMVAAGVQEVTITGIHTYDIGQQKKNWHFYVNGFVGENYCFNPSGLDGLPLTVEWFLMFGFECDKYPNYTQYKKYVGDFKLIYKILLKHNGVTEFWLEGNGSYDEYGETDLTDICKCVHQLQNLYFALTGQELTPNKI